MRAGARITAQLGRAVHRRALSLETAKRDDRQLALDFAESPALSLLKHEIAEAYAEPRRWRPEDEWEGEP